MEVSKIHRWFYALTLLWVILLLGLGSWWLFLVFELHSSLIGLNLPELGSQSSFLNMMKWEGSFFFIFLLLLGASLFLMYFRDMRKTRSMQAFFSSLSHELKTPLASMRLQAEVIKDLIEDESHSHAQLASLTQRLIQDTYKLESEFEKSLQLSRLEQGAPINLSQIGIKRFLKRQEQKIPSSISLELQIDDNASEVMADELGISMIFRNLIENTLRHNPEASKILIKVSKSEDMVKILYDDFGNKFTGDQKSLGNLFYKFNSTKGSGIGLYIIKSLMKKMGGNLEIVNNNRLTFLLTFKAGEEIDV